jgi:hypothetical protein
VALAARSIAAPDGIPCDILAAFCRGPYRIILRGIARHAHELAMEWSRSAAARLRWPRIIQVWRIRARQTPTSSETS